MSGYRTVQLRQALAYRVLNLDVEGAYPIHCDELLLRLTAVASWPGSTPFIPAISRRTLKFGMGIK
jgi:hypothetical protein